MGDARFAHVEETPGLPVPPVPFTVMGWPVRIVVWGLNPHYTSTMSEEKRQALAPPGTWDSYARFHVDGTRTTYGPEVLTWAVTSPYYYNLGTIAASLQAQQFHTLREYYHAKSPSDRLGAFWGRTNKFGVMAAEFLPFHSRKTAFPTNIRTFLGPDHPQLALADQLEAYHDVLLKTILDALGPEGWIIALGNATSEAIQMLLMKYGNITIQHVNGKIQVGSWTPHNGVGRYKVSFSPFMRTAGGPLNTNANIETWLQQVWT